jgi:hypothetical protein
MLVDDYTEKFERFFVLVFFLTVKQKQFTLEVQVLLWAHDEHPKFKRMYTEVIIILKKVPNCPI